MCWLIGFSVCLCLSVCVQETLEKMRERIEISSGSFDGPDMPIQQRMEELKHQD